MTVSPRLALWLVAAAIVALLSHGLLHLPMPFSDQFREIYFTLTYSIGESFAYYASFESYLFRPFEIIFRYLIVWVYGPHLLSYNAFQVTYLILVALAALALLPVRSWADAGAAIIAVTFLFGHHAFAAVLEPNITFSNGVILLLMLLSLRILQSEGGLAWQLLAIAVAAVAVLTKEVGLTIPVALVAGALLGFPGVRRWTAAVVIVIVAAYLAYRFAGLPSALSQVTDPGKAKSFAEYIANAAATPVMFVLGDPYEGDWNQFFYREFLPWRVIRLLAGVATLAVVVIGFRLSRTMGPGLPEDQVLDRKWLWLFLAVLAASAALGFFYTRHRFGAMALPIAFVLLNRSLRLIFWELSFDQIRPWARATGALCILLLALAWTSRTAGAFFVVRDMGSRTMLDWIESYDKYRGLETSFSPETLPYLQGFFWAAQETPWPTMQRDPDVIIEWLGDLEALNR